jgi:hypothetical protein
MDALNGYVWRWRGTQDTSLLAFTALRAPGGNSSVWRGKWRDRGDAGADAGLRLGGRAVAGGGRASRVEACARVEQAFKQAERYDVGRGRSREKHCRRGQAGGRWREEKWASRSA